MYSSPFASVCVCVRVSSSLLIYRYIIILYIDTIYLTFAGPQFYTHVRHMTSTEYRGSDPFTQGYTL